MAGSPKTPTELLQSWRGRGSRQAFDRLVALLYGELEQIAHGAMRHERDGHTLQTQALLHEAYVRLIDAKVDWKDRAHFLAVAARTMRRVLVDHGKAKRRLKRGGGVLVPLTGPIDTPAADPAPIDVLVLSDAIDRLAAQDERKAQIVELHFFGGLTEEETAEALDVSLSTVERDLRVARAWLRRDLSASAPDGAPAPRPDAV
jgi:RNA polymerase sigma factor (TIGR02999 family)